ncbi:MAG: tRNA pseudouridine(38-40) synthase TruA [Acidobacteria bacterium 13_1_40CM_2_64_6]|nr:MAG: tRNA pseudouridine(38-40) synthase TruA [Acidobacteria bacterium 13_1_40CM_2_64_6]OLE81321.1 MAG: tRNA pseudouridine(38-40) synthase TruA [Acidobacteria bacterium 13_1_20CM_2_65_9]
MPSFKIVVAYDGTDFVGWQRQASGVSIQSLLEDALRALDDREVTVTGAGRTDAGVHALEQVAAFSLERAIDPATLVRALNAQLPDSVRALSAAEVPATFNPRFNARAKTYRYRIWNGPVLSPFERRYAWHVPGALDVGAMAAAARRLEGRHDFAAFQAAGSDAITTEREVFVSRIADCGLRIHYGLPIGDRGLPPQSAIVNQSSIAHQSPIVNESAIRNPQSAMIEYEITGDGFLRHMVRAVVGTLVEIGRGRRRVAWIDEVLASRDRSAAGPTVPAAGLFLVAVDYGDAPCE